MMLHTLRSSLLLLLGATLLSSVGATTPGDVMMNSQTGKAATVPVTQLTNDLPSSPSMLTYINNWLKLASLLPFDVPSNKPMPAECTVTPGETLPKVNRASDDLARTYAKFAGASYCLADNMIRSWTCLGHCQDGTEGTEVVILDEDKITQIKYFVAVNHRLKAIILSIRGTLTPVNAIVDFSWVPLDLSDFPGTPKGTMAHAGFVVSALRIAGATRQKMVALANQYPSYSVDFTGHSLGGATAQLTGLNFASVTPIPPSRIRIITYGSPRVGNPLFAKVMAYAGFKIFTRVTFNNDPVPHLPPSNIFNVARFQHAPGEKYLSGWLGWTVARIRDLSGFSPKITECQDDKCEDPNCANSRVPYFNLLMHLRAFDVTFGPWC
ncbi:Alpha/Beta hydrolase protein [Syncephalis fuscata]|nr:Alpha/Beta hydrolase protein [Syncephalis fuscata]